VVQRRSSTRRTASADGGPFARCRNRPGGPPTASSGGRRDAVLVYADSRTASGDAREIQRQDDGLGLQVGTVECATLHYPMKDKLLSPSLRHKASRITRQICSCIETLTRFTNWSTAAQKQLKHADYIYCYFRSLINVCSYSNSINGIHQLLLFRYRFQPHFCSESFSLHCRERFTTTNRWPALICALLCDNNNQSRHGKRKILGNSIPIR
jgi:hypothetical protein